MTFAEKIKSLRKEKGLSQIELANALKMGRSCLSMIEIGRNEPTASNLILFADFFECSIDYLLDREDDFGNVNVSASSGVSLSKEEQELLRLFKKLDRDFRHRALGFMKKLADVNDDEHRIPPTANAENSDGKRA